MNKNIEIVSRVISNNYLSKDTFEMVLEVGEHRVYPGQFINIKIEGVFLRRPFCVVNSEERNITIIYKIVGEGSLILSKYKTDDWLNILAFLGNIYNYYEKKPLLIGGGVGCASLYYLAVKFDELKIKPTIIMGFKNVKEIFYHEQFNQLCNVVITTDDGSYGYKGNPITYLQEFPLNYDKYYACGPKIMLDNLLKISRHGYVSLETRMGCGFGACMGCSIKTSDGYKRICKEGPIFDAEELINE